MQSDARFKNTSRSRVYLPWVFGVNYNLYSVPMDWKFVKYNGLNKIYQDARLAKNFAPH